MQGTVAGDSFFERTGAGRPLTVLDIVARVFLVNLCLRALAIMTVLLPSKTNDIVALVAGAGLVAALLFKFVRGKNDASSR